jgi:hypothetical protein
MVEVHSSWGALWNTINGQEIGTPTSNATQHFKGNFDGDGDALFTCRVQTAVFGTGQRMSAATDYDSDAILDNWGAGFTTFDGDVENGASTYYWREYDTDDTDLDLELSGDLTAMTYRVQGVADTDGYTWEANTPGFRLPTDTDGPDPEIRLFNGAFQTDTDVVPHAEAGRWWERGPSIPSRIAYGRVTWDWMWHGTCDGTSGALTGRWCLPDGHPRLNAEGAGGDAILADGAVVGLATCTCSMDCPDAATATGPADGQVKYDMEHLIGFVEAAWGDGSDPTMPYGGAGVGSDEPDVHPRQQSALRIMARTGNAGEFSSMPDFLFDDCGITDQSTTSDAWAYAEDLLSPPSPHDDLDQVEFLVHALAGTSGYEDLVDIDRSTGSTGDFAGLRDDARIHSLDFGLLGTDGEWTQGPAGAVISEDNDDACLDTDGEYAIDDTLWWAQILDHWMEAFPCDSTDSLACSRLVGKVIYQDGAIDGTGAYEDCYVGNEYVVGRRGADYPVVTDIYDTDYTPEEGYTGRRNGVRFDSWMMAEVRRRYWEHADAKYMRYSLAWKKASYQAEVWNKLQSLVSEWRGGVPVVASSTEAYGYWDFDEAMRFARAAHLSVFNPKLDGYVPFHGASAPTGLPDRQTVVEDFCDCSPDPDGSCVALGIETLLKSTGYRIRRLSRALVSTQATNASFDVDVWFSNEGNAAPPLETFQLEFGIFKRNDTFDPLTPGDYAWQATYPRRSRGPLSGNSLDVRIASRFPTSLEPAGLIPFVQVNPEVAADYAGDCGVDQDDEFLCLESYELSGDAEDAHVYEFISTTLMSPVYALASITPTYQHRSFKATAGLTAPSVTGDYIIVYRFKDIATASMPAGIPAGGLSMDLPQVLQFGDGSTNRWYFVSNLEVTP